MSPDAVGHVGYVFLVAGTWLLSSRPRLGWALRATGTTVWLGIGVWLGMASLWLWGAVFLAVDLKGLWRARG